MQKEVNSDPESDTTERRHRAHRSGSMDQEGEARNVRDFRSDHSDYEMTIGEVDKTVIW